MIHTGPPVVWTSAGDYADIAYQRCSDGIAKITINRPEVGNAFRPKTLSELAQAFAQASDETEIGVIILAGEGDQAFCSGCDQRGPGAADRLGNDRLGRRYLGRLDVLRGQMQRTSKPTIAMVAGHAIGGGHMLHLLCDVTIAADNAVFGQIDPFVGLFGSGHDFGMLAGRVGQRFAREMWLLRRQYTARRAYEMGLVNAVIPLAGLEAETVTWAREMLALPPVTLQLLKASFNARNRVVSEHKMAAGPGLLHTAGINGRSRW